MRILNIAAGQRIPSYYKKTDKLIQLDLRYYTSSDIQEVEGDDLKSFERCQYGLFYIKEDAFQFLERTILKFNNIACHRFLEHIPMDRVLYFIYQMSEVLELGGEVDIIVPDYKKLARMLLAENINDPEWQNTNIILTTEIVNDPGNPHASIWTAERLKYFFELEKRFETVVCESDYMYDGRDIYLHYIAKRR